MNAPEVPAPPDAGVIIREQQPGERAAVRDVIIRAFDEIVVADLAEALQDRPDPRRGASLVAEIGGELVGHVQLSWSWLDAPARLVDVLVLSPLSVVPEHQRQGIGGQLVRHAIATARQLGAPLLFLEGDPRYYGRFGFQAGGDHGFTAPSVRIPAPAFQVVVLDAHEPWMTGALVYADTFWALDCVGLRGERLRSALGAG
jgi:putative acetyltransferase